MGASIALDDFGTGLSSFEYLKLFKPDWIKIDGSFVRDALLNPLGAEVVASMIRVARAAGCYAVAEQVEDQATIDLMTQLGAHFVQGYAISKPRPLTEMIEAVRDLSPTIRSNDQGDSALSSVGEHRANPSVVAARQTKLRNVIELGV
jgi:diguanylate cyclase